MLTFVYQEKVHQHGDQTSARKRRVGVSQRGAFARRRRSNEIDLSSLTMGVRI